MRMRCLLALLLFACVAPAWAGELRKCVMPGGRHVYVDGVCPAGSRIAWRRETLPERDPDALVKRRMDEVERWQRAVRSEVAARMMPASVRSGPQARTERAATGNRCERERARRARIRDQDWMRMTYDRMVQLDQDVREACR